MPFTLDPVLVRDTHHVAHLPLCSVRLMDARQFPWLVLIPRVEDMREWIDLERAQQHQLSDEIAVVSHILKALVTPDKLNIATLGNQVPQMHVHLIARYKSDSAWPKPVWGHAFDAYEEAERQRLIYELRTALESLELGEA